MELAKGAILFIYQDKFHDFEQVERFERGALEISEEYTSFLDASKKK